MTKSNCRLARSALLISLLSCTLTVTGAELPNSVAEDVGMSSERLLRINAAMQRRIEAGDIQGAVTAVARRGKVVHFEAHGLMDVDTGKPMEKDAIFIMMSSTKPVLGVAAMMMIEEGLIRTSDPVSRYIPEFKNMQVAVLKVPADEDVSQLAVDSTQAIPEHRLVPAEREVTIHHLLTHTSGVMSGGLGNAVAGEVAQRDTLANYIPAVAQAPLDFQPGSRWAYSGGTGLDVVARIIEIVSGQPYDEFVRERIFEPLGMKDTHYNLPSEKEERRVAIRGGGMERWVQPTTYFSGSYGLSSTAADYLRFEQMLVRGGELFNNRLLGTRTVELMARNQSGSLYRDDSPPQLFRLGQGFGYTVAVVIEPIASEIRRSAGAFGWGGAFGTISWSDPKEELTAVIMLQQPHLPTHYEFENAIRQAIID